MAEDGDPAELVDLVEGEARYGGETAEDASYSSKPSKALVNTYYNQRISAWQAYNAKAAELIEKDEYDFYVVYNGNYDSRMHKNGPESESALSQLEKNSAAFAGRCSSKVPA